MQILGLSLLLLFQTVEVITKLTWIQFLVGLHARGNCGPTQTKKGPAKIVARRIRAGNIPKHLYLAPQYEHGDKPGKTHVHMHMKAYLWYACIYVYLHCIICLKVCMEVPIYFLLSWYNFFFFFGFNVLRFEAIFFSSFSKFIFLDWKYQPCHCMMQLKL